MIIVKSKIKEAAEIDGKFYNVSSDFADELDSKVKKIVADACKRARANGRNTVMAKDL